MRIQSRFASFEEKRLDAEPVGTPRTFLDMMEGTTLRHIPAGTVFQLDG
jgi:hypothetical protein